MPDTPLFDAFPPVSTDDWEAKIHEDLRGKDYDRMLVWDSLEGLTVQPYYRAEDLDDLVHVDPDSETPVLAASVETPANDWAIRQDVAHPDLDEANRLARQALERGATDLGVVVHVRGDRVEGVPVQSADDLAALLRGVPLAQTPIHLSSGPEAVALMTFLYDVADRHGVKPRNLKGSVDFDPLAALATGAMTDPGRAFDLSSDLTRGGWLHPNVRTLAVNATPYHNAGASLVDEVAFTLGAVAEHLTQGTDRRVNLAALVKAMHLVVPVSTSFFLEIAKLRALRLLVPQVIQPFADAEGAAVTPRPTGVHIQAAPSQRTETRTAPYVNLLRGTTETMAAAIGGADVIRTARYDRQIDDPSDFAERIARNTQLILKMESHLDQVADPAAGSYYVEAVTDQLARRAWDRFQALEADGGLLANLQSGRVQARIAETREARMKEVKTRKRVLVGTNHYPDLSESTADGDGPDGGAPLRMSEFQVQAARVDVEMLQDLADEGSTLGDLLAAVRTAAPEFHLEEDSGEADGDDTGMEPLPAIRVAEPFEDIREQVDAYAREHGGAPVVTLLPIGHPAMRSARANFARNVYGTAGLDVRENLRFEDAAAGIAQAAEDGAAIVVLCSSDPEYADLVPAARRAMKRAGLDARLIVAGSPEKIDADLDADGFIHAGSPLYETLKDDVARLIGVGES